MALAAGFGLDLERCDPEVFDELLDLLDEQSREQERERLARELKTRMG